MGEFLYKKGGDGMPSDREVRIIQRQKLYMLLTIERDIKTLEGFKNQLFAEMDDEDIAIVQKTVNRERQ